MEPSSLARISANSASSSASPKSGQIRCMMRRTSSGLNGCLNLVLTATCLTASSTETETEVSLEAAFTTCSSKHATVIGPTPPGTGVRKRQCGRRASASTSPWTMDLPSAFWTRWMPTSMTTAWPSGLRAAGSHSRWCLPAATTKMSAWRVISNKFSVCWSQKVTVAAGPFSLANMRPRGLPTMFDFPTITHRLPFVSTP
mmetsp:Transcript_7530/g.27645  ORF Transcript_7530/g.27645 Transcript_7530/m.27645 type:complete len:200 (-) Transcript_7530:460-1059(-)